MTTTTVYTDADLRIAPYGEQSAEVYYLPQGRLIATISGKDDRWIMDPSPAGARWATYWFASRDDAIGAAVCYATRGYWTNEVSPAR